MRHRITKTGAMLGAAVLLAGVSLASAQGMKEGPGGGAGGGPSPGISGGGGERGGGPSAAPGGAEPRKGGAPARGESSPGGGEKMDRGAQRPSMQDRTTGQGSRESTKPEPKAAPAPEQKAQPAPEPKAGKAAQDKAAKDKAAQDKAKSTTGQGIREGAKPAPDQKAQPQPSQQPQQQTQQPQRQQQPGTTGAGTATQQPGQPSGAATQTQPSGAATQSATGVTIDAQKQASIQQSVLSARNAPRVSSVNFAVSTGTVVPSHVRFVSVSTFPILIDVFPHYRDHVFFIVEDEIVILEPRSRRIVDVVPVGPRRVSRGGGTSVEVLQLTEAEIREVQLVLVQRGLLVQADVTGVLNERTKTALITFQRKEGLQASGSIDVRTVSALGLSNKVGPQKTGATGSSPTTGQAPAGTQQPAQPSAQQGQPGQQQPQAQPGGQQSQQGTTGQGQPSAQGQTPSTTGQSSDPSTTGQGNQPAQANPPATTGQGNTQPPAQSPQNQNRPNQNPSGTAPSR